MSNRALSRDDKSKQMAKTQEKKNIRAYKNRKYLEDENNHKKMNMIKRMDSIENRIKDKRIQNDRENIKKREEGNVKFLERNITIQRMLRKRDYINKLKMDELEEKERKLNEFKRQREILAWQRTQASLEVQKQKEEVVLKFDKLARQKKEIEPEMIRELFPGDNELYENVKEMKRKQKETEENIIKKFDSYDKKNKSMSNAFYNKSKIEIDAKTNIENNSKEEINDKGEKEKEKEKEDNKEKKEKEIQKKVEEFKANEYKEFDKLINEEKEKEEERTKMYENEKDETKKLEIEKKNKEERELASKNINQHKDDIDKRIKEYEEKLRKEA